MGVIDEILADWARWHRASAFERRSHWYPPRTPWATGPTNWMTAENDSNDLWDAKHSSRMRMVEAAVDDLPEELRSAVYQVFGLGTLGAVKYGEDSLRAAFEIAVSDLAPLMEKRGIVL